MHELSLVYQIVKTVDEVKKEQNLTEIEQITLNIGEMTDVVPRFIEEAWSVAKESTDYPNAKMVVNVIEGVARCNSCGEVQKVKSFDFECPKCHSLDLKIIEGREFEIREIIAR